MKFAFALAAFVLAGCASVGPASVAHDRFDYVEAISDSGAARNFLMSLFSLTETGAAQAGPVVTVPTR